jgi:methyl-accepting chemotaxis protein
MRSLLRTLKRRPSPAAPKATRTQSGNAVTRLSDALGGRFTLVIKLGLLIVLLTVPSVLAGASYVGSINTRVSVNNQELAGVDVLKPALNAMVGLAVLDGPLPDLSDLKAAVARHPELGLDDLTTAVGAAATGTDATAKANLATALNNLILADANNSGLVLDADLDSFYVMDSLAFRVPVAFSRYLTANSNYLDTTHSDTGATSEALIKANIGTQAVLAGQLNSTADTINANVQASVDATRDPGLKDDLMPLVALSAMLSNEGSKLTNSLQNPAPSAFTGVAPAATKAIDPAASALDRLLQTRINEVSASRDRMLTILVIALVLAFAWSAVVWLNTRHSVAIINSAVAGLARRDLTRKALPNGKDEFARIGAGLETAREQLASAFGKLASASGQVAAVATQLSATTHTVDDSAKETLDQSQAAAREINDVQNMLSTVSDSGGELTQATHEISSTMAQVNDAAQHARADLDHATELASGLGDSSQRISESVAAIVAIASKTRLLALNATIEAARAGEAGRGFAVVAAEVQVLAQQSAAASEAIGRVADDQHTQITNVIAALGRASAAVREAAEAQATVAAAAEEQTATLTQVTDSITGSALASTRIADQMSRVETVAFGTAGTVGQLRQAAEDFDAVARSLSDQVGAFTIT